MANWDIFHSDRLEVERNLSTAEVRAGVARGEIRQDDLARPAGSSETWARLSDLPGLASDLADDDAIDSASPDLEGGSDDEVMDLTDYAADDDGESPEGHAHEAGSVMPSGVRRSTTEDVDPTGFPDSYDRDLDLDLRSPAARVSLPIDQDDDYDPQAQDEEAAEFTLSRSSAETVEELDLAAMVDVAFQLVLFFLVTASTIVFKTLEVPKPNPEDKKGSSSAASAGTKTIDDLAKDNILVDIDPSGNIKVDREPAPTDFEGLVERLRTLRTETQRTGMLLTAESLTRHKYAVMAYDAANEIGLRISIATPKPVTEKPPFPAAAPKAQ